MRELVPDRQRQLQIGGDERVEQPIGEEQSEAAAGHREQRALGDELPNEPPSPGAEREPDRDFLAPARRARRAADWRRLRTQSAARSRRRPSG